MPLISRTPVSQAACTLPTLPAPASPLVEWATAQQARAVVGSRLELVVVELVDLVREALLVAMVELAVAVVVADAVVAVDAVEVEDVVEEVEGVVVEEVEDDVEAENSYHHMYVCTYISPLLIFILELVSPGSKPPSTVPQYF